jgi:eukaryotic-like serine/threonine-protein kinase
MSSDNRCNWLLTAATAMLTASAMTLSAGADEMPPSKTSWASFRNGNAQLGVAGGKLPDNLELLWKLEDDDGFVATAAIVGESVYAGGLSGWLYCLDRRTGRVVWKYRSIDDPDPKKFAPGFKSAPTVTAQNVFVGDEDGVLHAVSRETGKAVWKFTTNGEIAGGAAIEGENVIVGSHDSHLYCVKAADGELVWKFQTMDRINCSPAIVEGYTFVAGCDEHLRVIDLKDGTQKSDIPLESYLIASPAVLGDMLYVGTYAGEVLAVNWKTDTIEWRYKDPVKDNPYHASAAVTDKLVVVGGQDKQLHCIDRQSGRRVWAFAARGQVNSSPVIAGDRVYFGSNDRNVYAVSLKDGKELWKHNAGRSISAGPAVGENVLVVGTEGSNGALFCFGAK